MVSISLSPSPPPRISSLSSSTTNNNRPVVLSHQAKLFGSSFVARSSRSLSFNPLSFSFNYKDTTVLKKNKKKKRGFGAVCYASPLTASNLQWISTIASAVLMLAKGTAAHKAFLVPLFALQAPTTIISWIKGDYGTWAAFLALLVRLFFVLPAVLELPFVALLLVIVVPHQVMNLRARQEGAIIALVIAAYMAFQHFSRAGSLEKSFERGSIVATLAIICIAAVSCFFLF